MSEIDLNTLFAEWLHNQHEELTKKGSKLAYAYSKAEEKVRAFPEPITTPKQLKGIQFVGDKIFNLLCGKLKKHCSENDISPPDAFATHVEERIGGKRLAELDQEQTTKRRVSKWIPKRRSGSWAILVLLHLYDKYRKGLRKEEVISYASAFCDSSFTSNPAARDFYSAWEGIKTLLKRELVLCIGRPKVYTISEEGERMAEAIVQQEGIAGPQEDEVDHSFDNGIRATPDTSKVDSLRLFVDTTSSPLRGKGGADRETGIEEGSTAINGAGEAKEKIHDVANKIYDGVPYNIWAPEDYEVALIVDNREIRSQNERDFFRSRIESNSVDCSVRSLSVGDVLWVARHLKTGKEVVLNYVCERKRLDDLAMSIKDGRFTNQKNRLKKSGIRHVHYLVEEGGLGDVQRIIEMKKSIETAISMAVTVSNFYVQRFRRTDDTIDWLVTMTEILKQRYLSTRLLVVKPQSVNSQDEYLEILDEFRAKFEDRGYECVHTFSVFQSAMVKSNMMTVKDMFVLMLMLVRGVTFEKAVAIQQHFKTPKFLVDYYQEHRDLSEAEKEGLLQSLFHHLLGTKKINRPTLKALYESWGT